MNNNSRMNPDPRKAPGVKLVGRKVDVPNLQQLDGLKRTGDLDITHKRFHHPAVMPLVDADGRLQMWGVICLGCSILQGGPMAGCQMYQPADLEHDWPTSPFMIEVAVQSTEPAPTEEVSE